MNRFHLTKNIAQSASTKFGKAVRLAAICVPFALANNAIARSPSDAGPYFGFGYSQIKVKDAEEFNDDNDAYNVILGTQLNSVFALEGGYINFGSYGSDLASAETTGITLGIKGGIPIGDVLDIYAQAGMLWWETDYDVIGSSGSIDGQEPFYGVGVSFGLTDTLHLRAEYNRYQVEFDEDDSGPLLGSARDADLDQALVGISFYF
ncbi:MAG: outer membrane beta-barrel protein [Gammaproteobacteria bacterium]|nr:outer membrane beta-barrel protein [Gammaproteobacteria bacterium]